MSVPARATAFRLTFEDAQWLRAFRDIPQMSVLDAADGFQSRRLRQAILSALLVLLMTQSCWCRFVAGTSGTSTLVSPNEVLVQLSIRTSRAANQTVSQAAQTLAAENGMEVVEQIRPDVFLMRIIDGQNARAKAKLVVDEEVVLVAQPNFQRRIMLERRVDDSIRGQQEEQQGSKDELSLSAAAVLGRIGSQGSAARVDGGANPLAGSSMGAADNGTGTGRDGEGSGMRGKTSNPNRVTPNDPKWSTLWGLRRTRADYAWATFTGNRTVRVCVIDTGIDAKHPDLQANVHQTLFYDAITSRELAPFDDHGHGTHIAGTIGATANNRDGVVGMAWDVEILGCKFLDNQGYGFDSDAIKCLDWCRSNGALITSNSWGGGKQNDLLRIAIEDLQEEGGLFVAAAGNAGDNWPQFPAAYPVPIVLSVVSTTSDDQLSDFSTHGIPHTHIGAPGSDILSTLPNATYAQFSGTSMATPHVAGAAALVWMYTGLRGAPLKQRLMDSADAVPGLQGKCTTGARLNVRRAVTGDFVPRSPPVLPPPKSPIGASYCPLIASGSNWAAIPYKSVAIDRAHAYGECCRQCEANANCVAFSATTSTIANLGSPSAAMHGNKQDKTGGPGSPAMEAAGWDAHRSTGQGEARPYQCSTCDAWCDLLDRMPARLCTPGEAGFFCAYPPLGAGIMPGQSPPTQPSPSPNPPFIGSPRRPSPSPTAGCERRSRNVTYAAWDSAYQLVDLDRAYGTCCRVCRDIPACRAFSAYKVPTSQSGRTNVTALHQAGRAASSVAMQLPSQCTDCGAYCE